MRSSSFSHTTSARMSKLPAGEHDVVDGGELLELLRDHRGVARDGEADHRLAVEPELHRVGHGHDLHDTGLGEPSARAAAPRPRSARRPCRSPRTSAARRVCSCSMIPFERSSSWTGFPGTGGWAHRTILSARTRPTSETATKRTSIAAKSGSSAREGPQKS